MGVVWPAPPPVGRARGAERALRRGQGRSIGLAIPMLSVVFPLELNGSASWPSPGVTSGPGRVGRRPEGRPSLILKSKAENLSNRVGERPAIEKPIAMGRVQGASPDARFPG